MLVASLRSENFDRGKPFLKQGMKVSLSIVMFLQLFVPGATMPVMSLYLKDYLHFSGAQIGIILSMSSIAAFVSPLIGAFIADRVLSAEKLLGFLHLFSAVIIILFSFQKDFLPVLFVYMAYSLTFGPTMALANAVTFHHLPDNRNHFGRIRVWGTIGWIAAAWVFGLLWLRNNGGVSSHLPDIFKISAVSSLLLGFYVWTIPSSYDGRKEKPSFIPVESLKVLIRPEILILSLFGFFISFVDRFYFFGGAPFLKQLGFSEQSILPVLSIGQIPEIFAMSLLGFSLSRFGFKKVFLLGVFLEVFRFAVFALGGPPFLLIAAISVHGLTYTFFFTALFIYLDSHCDKRSRAGVQQLFCLITGGLAGFLGNFCAGRMMDVSGAIQNGIRMNSYSIFWGTPALLSLVVFVGILVFFRIEREVISASRQNN
jgi:nucleoside transporter